MDLGHGGCSSPLPPAQGNHPELNAWRVWVILGGRQSWEPLNFFFFFFGRGRVAKQQGKLFPPKTLFFGVLLCWFLCARWGGAWPPLTFPWPNPAPPPDPSSWCRSEPAGREGDAGRGGRDHAWVSLCPLVMLGQREGEVEGLEGRGSSPGCSWVWAGGGGQRPAER